MTSGSVVAGEVRGAAGGCEVATVGAGVWPLVGRTSATWVGRAGRACVVVTSVVGWWAVGLTETPSAAATRSGVTDTAGGVGSVGPTWVITWGEGHNHKAAPIPTTITANGVIGSVRRCLPMLTVSGT